MTINFTCSSISEFDPETGKYKPCGKELAVDDSKAGNFVECPACGNFVEVPQVAPAPKPQGTAARASNSNAASASRPAGQRTAAGVGPTEKSSPQSNKPNPASPFASTTPDELRRKDLVSEGIETDAVASKQLSYSSLDNSGTCIRCKATLPTGATHCPHCGAPRKAIWATELPLEQMVPKLSGMQLWSAKLIRGRNVNGVLVIVNCFVYGLLGAASLASIVAIGPLCLLVVVPSVLMGIFYTQLLVHSRRIARTPAAPLTWWQKMLWNGLGSFIRSRKWKAPLSTLKDPIVIRLRDSEVNDQSLPQIPELAQCDVLDLQNTSISDDGLRYIRGLTKLKYLDLRGTKVTAEGVFRVQHTIPKVWIWF